MKSYRTALAKKHIPILFVLLVMSLGVTGCAQIAPWERGNLAKPQMAMDLYPMLNEMRGHNFGSREAGSVSGSGGGGGCGCY